MSLSASQRYSRCLLSLYLLLYFLLHVCFLTHALKKTCGPSLKEVDGKCVSLTNADVLRAMHHLAHPPSVPEATCKKVSTVQDIAVCEDDLDVQDCRMVSTITSQQCDHYGSLEFEKHWADKGCKVTLFHFTTKFKGNVCNLPAGKMTEHPNIEIRRMDMWAKHCFNCLYPHIDKLLSGSKKIDVLKVQEREGVNEDFDGVQYTILSDLFLHKEQEILSKVKQIVYSAGINSQTLTDTVGREAEQAWNMWATEQLLRSYGAFSVVSVKGPSKLQPWQFEHTLYQAEIDHTISSYKVSLRKLEDEGVKAEVVKKVEGWKPRAPKSELKGRVPSYCKVPSTEEDAKMQEWIYQEMKPRCHPTYLGVPCTRTRSYDALIPCPQEMMNNLAEDYAASKNWCDFEHPGANIQPLTKVDAGANAAFQKPSIPQEEGVRLAFFFTVYTDVGHVRRVFNHLYSPTHYYLFHVDPAGSSVEFEKGMRELASNYTNVFIAKDVPIVYGASTATILLTRAMAWFLYNARGWDYFVPLTGSDYPLLPLHRMEKIFQYQNPPMPFVMAWTPGTSTHIFRLTKTHPVFEFHPEITKSIAAVNSERGRVLGVYPMHFRSSNFGPPVFCNNQSSFYHLDNRLNKSGNYYDTQWLFPRGYDGYANPDEFPESFVPSADGVWRVWKKSDPATTGAYDRESIKYIIESIEGKKYWHFFKHMLLGSEEHYYVSLLYNWPRTKQFVQTLSAEVVWNTWKIGLIVPSAGFQTHTNFLTLNEWDIIKGFSLRGMVFARKFSSTKTGALLDRIDREILFNSSSEAGLYWPGFYQVDITTPGKQWVKEYRTNHAKYKKLEDPSEWVAAGTKVGAYKPLNGSAYRSI